MRAISLRLGYNERVANLGESTTSAYGAGYRAGRGLVRAGDQMRNLGTQAGKRLSETGALIKERGSEARTSVGAGARRGGFASVGSFSAPRNYAELGQEAKNMAVKGGPVLFWLVAGIAVVKDMIDVASLLIDGLGIALTATAIGAPVGIALGFLSEVIDKIAGMMIDFTLVAYFGYIGGGFALRIVIMSVGALIDAIPFMNVLPLTTVSFFAAYFFGRAVKTAASSTVIRNTARVAQFASGGASRLVNYAGRIAKYI